MVLVQSGVLLVIGMEAGVTATHTVELGDILTYSLVIFHEFSYFSPPNVESAVILKMK